MYLLRINKGKAVRGFWGGEASDGKVTRRSVVNKSCLVRFVIQS